MKFDIEITKQFENTCNIDYGIVNGDSTIVFIKAGQDGSLYGYNNKYIKMARRLNEKYGCSVICSSNPFDGEDHHFSKNADVFYEIPEKYLFFEV